MSSFMKHLITRLSHYPCYMKSIPTVSHALVPSRFYSHIPVEYEIADYKEEARKNNTVIEKVNEFVAAKSDRLFAVVHVAGKQFKITSGDVIVIEGYWPPNTGDKLILEKVLLVGSTNFTLIGRPIIQKGLVGVHATVIEKALSHTKVHFRKKRRKQYMRTHFFRIPQTYLRINNIEFEDVIDNPSEVRGLKNIIF